MEKQKEKFLLLLDGMMGAGKTATATLLSEKLPRTAIIGMDKIKRFVSDFERGTRDNAIARSVVTEMTRKYLDLGLSVIIEQPFRFEDEIKLYDNMAKEFSIPFYKFQLFTTPEIAFKRIIKRQENLTIKVPEERIRNNIGLYESREKLGFALIDTTNMKPEEVSEYILKKL